MISVFPFPKAEEHMTGRKKMMANINAAEVRAFYSNPPCLVSRHIIQIPCHLSVTKPTNYMKPDDSR